LADGRYGDDVLTVNGDDTLTKKKAADTTTDQR
jgi:hypothetical protein